MVVAPVRLQSNDEYDYSLSKHTLGVMYIFLVGNERLTFLPGSFIVLCSSSGHCRDLKKYCPTHLQSGAFDNCKNSFPAMQFARLMAASHFLQAVYLCYDMENVGHGDGQRGEKGALAPLKPHQHLPSPKPSPQPGDATLVCTLQEQILPSAMMWLSSPDINAHNRRTQACSTKTLSPFEAGQVPPSRANMQCREAHLRIIKRVYSGSKYDVRLR